MERRYDTISDLRCNESLDSDFGWPVASVSGRADLGRVLDSCAGAWLGLGHQCKSLLPGGLFSSPEHQGRYTGIVWRNTTMLNRLVLFLHRAGRQFTNQPLLSSSWPRVSPQPGPLPSLRPLATNIYNQLSIRQCRAIVRHRTGHFTPRCHLF